MSCEAEYKTVIRRIFEIHGKVLSRCYAVKTLTVKPNIILLFITYFLIVFPLTPNA